jgi:hypothetical protein
VSCYLNLDVMHDLTTMQLVNIFDFLITFTTDKFKYPQMAKNNSAHKAFQL